MACCLCIKCSKVEVGGCYTLYNQNGGTPALACPTIMPSALAQNSSSSSRLPVSCCTSKMTENGKFSPTDDTALMPICDNKEQPTPCDDHDEVASMRPKDTVTHRETWGKNFEFLLSVIGFAVDLGNVWRFPYVCYSNGGGAFLIPYVIMYLFGGLPLFYLELALGQYQRVGCISVWKRICPLFQGIGYAICIIAFYVSIYYNTIIAWALYYFFASLRKKLPWSSCHNSWNTKNCVEFDQNIGENFTRPDNSTLGAQEFFDRRVLEFQHSTGLDDLGPIKWSIALCLLAVFLIVYFALWKGIKTSGKAVWVTAIFPYIVLIILLIRGVTLPGAPAGIQYYLTPKWSRLRDHQVWIAAGTQVFFSLGPGFGVLLALSSYNKYDNNCYRDALITSLINCLTSLLAGFVVFSGIGFMASKLNKDVSLVAQEGPGLVFQVYPEVLAQLPGSPFFAAIFFLMLVTLGLDSTFGGLEALITGVLDEFNILRRHREIFVAVLLSMCFLTSLATTTYGGKYLFQLLDRYAVSISIVFIVLLEAVAVNWCYGFRRFSQDIKRMLGFEPGYFWQACWAVTLFCLSLYDETRSSVVEIAGYTYPSWTIGLVWTIKCSSLVCVPIVAIYKLLSVKGTFWQRLMKCLQPEESPDLPVPDCLTISTECTEVAQV